jgi:uncharacterized repeat protein (TIGR04138 family)
MTPQEDSQLQRQIADFCQRDPRFPAEAFHFMGAALRLGMIRHQRRHVSPKELVESARELAQRAFGPMASFTLREWRLRRTEDLGQLVLAMVEAGLFSLNDADRIEDFANGFDFEEAFVAPYRPAGHLVTPPVIA